MLFRIATIEDVPQMQTVRNAVKENRLSSPDVIRNADYLQFLDENGRGWVCVVDQQITGFAIVDLQQNNVWALFVLPEFEHKGIGKELHQLMLDWYFHQTIVTLWLGTEPGTRAEKFYKQMGWVPVGKNGKHEVKFEMSYEAWLSPK